MAQNELFKDFQMVGFMVQKIVKDFKNVVHHIYLQRKYGGRLNNDIDPIISKVSLACTFTK